MSQFQPKGIALLICLSHFCATEGFRQHIAAGVETGKVYNSNDGEKYAAGPDNLRRARKDAADFAVTTASPLAAMIEQNLIAHIVLYLENPFLVH